MKMSGNVILITGGGSGIGRGLAEAFHDSGNQVIIAGRRKQKLGEVLEANPGMKSLELDIESPESIQQFTEKFIKECPALNVVIHNAGIMRAENLLKSKDTSDAEAMLQTNLFGTIRLNTALLPHLLKQPQASIMTVSSGLAFLPLAMTPTYCATKAAIHSYTQSLRYQLKDSSVQVLELIPPYVQTELMGSRQTQDHMAMPLSEFIDEVMQILKKQPNATEICVERVKFLRDAASKGEYEAFFKHFNDQMTEAFTASAVR